MNAVNITKYIFKTARGGQFYYNRGFGLMNEEGKFASIDGIRPYVLDTKKCINAIIYGITEMGTQWNFVWIDHA